MKQSPITRINGVDIFAVEKDGEIYVPVKPICTAIGVDFAAQRNRIQRHRKLSSVVVTMTTTGADGKQYEMVCLPLKYTYGWVFSIDSSLVSETARPAVERYQDECYEVLYEHFTCSLRQQIDTNAAEIELLEKIADAASRERDAKAEGKALRASLDKLRAERLNPQPTIF